MVDIDELKASFLNKEYDSGQFELEADKLVTVAEAYGEVRPEFTDPQHPEFQATPAFLASLGSGRMLPIDFPRLGGIPMDGGKAVSSLKPVRPGVTLTRRAHLHDIYDKSGRSGRMIFIVARIEISNADDEVLAVCDTRMVIREKPAA